MIVAEHVTKYYGARAAVSDLSFAIEAGEVVGLLGLNGAGKTTTLKILSGLLLPTSGRVHVAGLDMREFPEAVRSRIGFLPETPPLYPEMTVVEFLSFVARIKGLRKAVGQAVEEALAATDLLAVRDQRIGTLSNGFQRRVGIAQAVVHRPDLILLDEPTSGLDPVQIVHMRKLIRALHERHTVLVSSHILSEIHQLCDRIFVLQEGRVAGVGTEEELARRVSAAVTLTLEVRGPKAQLEKTLSAVPEVTRSTIDSVKDDVVQCTVELGCDRREAVARAIVESGLGLLRLERLRIELESIFLRLTGGEADATEPAATPRRAAS